MLSCCLIFCTTWLASCMRPLVARSMNLSSSGVREMPSACACWRSRSLRKFIEFGSKLSILRTAGDGCTIQILLSLPLRLAFLHKGVDAFFHVFGLHQLFQVNFLGADHAFIEVN